MTEESLAPTSLPLRSFGTKVRGRQWEHKASSIVIRQQLTERPGQSSPSRELRPHSAIIHPSSLRLVLHRCVLPVWHPELGTVVQLEDLSSQH